MRTLITLAAAAMLAATPLAADIVKTRIASMEAYGAGLKTLGGMVRGQAAYDAALASEAAQAILVAASADPAMLFPEGTDEMMVDGTRAKVDIWDNWDDFAAKYSAMAMAAEGLAAQAGQGEAELAAGFGAFAGTCRSCHQAYRAPKN